jgi:hypothetical protein
MSAGWSDARPNDHDRPGLSRIRPCTYCEHEEHAMQCEALIDPLVSRDAVCPCKDVPVPGVHVPTPRSSRWAHLFL